MTNGSEIRDEIFNSMEEEKLVWIEDISTKVDKKPIVVRQHLSAMEKEGLVAYFNEFKTEMTEMDEFDSPTISAKYVKLTSEGKIAKETFYEDWKEINSEGIEKLAFHVGKFIQGSKERESREEIIKWLNIAGVLTTAVATLVVAYFAYKLP